MSRKVIIALIAVIVFVILVCMFVNMRQNDKNKENNKEKNIVQNENINRVIMHIDEKGIEDKKRFEWLDGENF